MTLSLEMEIQILDKWYIKCSLLLTLLKHLFDDNYEMNVSSNLLLHLLDHDSKSIPQELEGHWILTVPRELTSVSLSLCNLQR